MEIEKIPPYIKWWNKVNIPNQCQLTLIYFGHEYASKLNWVEIKKIYNREKGQRKKWITI